MSYKRGHVNLYHLEKKIECPTCGKKFAFKAKLRQHESVHLKRKFECKICRKTFCDRASRKKHIEIEHKKDAANLSIGIKINKEKNRFECPICKKKMRGNLEVHVSTVHEKKKYFECPICNKKLKGNLEMHVSAVHEKKRHFECQLCKKRFAQHSTLGRHIKGIHGEKKISKQNSEECDQNSDTGLQIKEKQDSALVKKKSVRKKVEKKGVDKRINYCKSCDQQFTSKNELIVHKLSAHKKQIKCTICNKDCKET